MEQSPAPETDLSITRLVEAAGVTTEAARAILVIRRISQGMKFPSAVMVGPDLLLMPNEACYALKAGKHLERGVGRCCDVWPSSGTGQAHNAERFSNQENRSSSRTSQSRPQTLKKTAFFT